MNQGELLRQGTHSRLMYVGLNWSASDYKDNAVTIIVSAGTTITEIKYYDASLQGDVTGDEQTMSVSGIIGVEFPTDGIIGMKKPEGGMWRISSITATGNGMFVYGL